jgi:hypothetical protein
MMNDDQVLLRAYIWLLEIVMERGCVCAAHQPQHVGWKKDAVYSSAGDAMLLLPRKLSGVSDTAALQYSNATIW